jgi:hypothetical protein
MLSEPGWLAGARSDLISALGWDRAGCRRLHPARLSTSTASDGADSRRHRVRFRRAQRSRKWRNEHKFNFCFFRRSLAFYFLFALIEVKTPVRTQTNEIGSPNDLEFDWHIYPVSFHCKFQPPPRPRALAAARAASPEGTALTWRFNFENVADQNGCNAISLFGEYSRPFGHSEANMQLVAWMKVFRGKVDTIFATLSWYVFPLGHSGSQGLDQIQLPRFFHIMKMEFGWNARQLGDAQNSTVQIGLYMPMQFFLRVPLLHVEDRTVMSILLQQLAAQTMGQTSRGPLHRTKCGEHIPPLFLQRKKS